MHIARSMMDIYDEYDADLIDMVREANRPGLLQTEGYMRALFATRNARNSRDRVANDVAARLHRKQRLTDEEFPLELAAIVDEAALRRKVGGIKVMREQLLHEAGQHLVFGGTAWRAFAESVK